MSCQEQADWDLYYGKGKVLAARACDQHLNRRLLWVSRVAKAYNEPFFVEPTPLSPILDHHACGMLTPEEVESIRNAVRAGMVEQPKDSTDRALRMLDRVGGLPPETKEIRIKRRR